MAVIVVDQSSAISTIEAALALATPGDVIVIKSGNYSPNGSLIRHRVAIFAHPNVVISYDKTLFDNDVKDNVTFIFDGYADLVATGSESVLIRDAHTGSRFVINARSHSTTTENASIALNLVGDDCVYDISFSNSAKFCTNNGVILRSLGSGLVKLRIGGKFCNLSNNIFRSDLILCDSSGTLDIQVGKLDTQKTHNNAGSSALIMASGIVSMAVSELATNTGTCISQLGGELNASVSGSLSSKVKRYLRLGNRTDLVLSLMAANLADGRGPGFIDIPDSLQDVIQLMRSDSDSRFTLSGGTISVKWFDDGSAGAQGVPFVDPPIVSVPAPNVSAIQSRITTIKGTSPAFLSDADLATLKASIRASNPSYVAQS
jgi:hypothetical protein